MAGIVYTQKLCIERPRAAVFSYLADLSHSAAWNPFVVQASKISLGPPVLGSQFELRLRLAWREFGLSYQITGLEAGQMLEMQGIAESFKLIERFLLSELETDHSCYLIYQLEVQDPKFSRGTARMLEPILCNNGPLVLQSLKKSLEGEPSQWQGDLWSRLGEKLLLPALFGLTRAGFAHRKQKQRWTALTRPLIAQQRMLLTGATSDLGIATACGLAKLGADLILVARHEKKLRHLGELIQAETGRLPTLKVANLALMREVRALAEDLLRGGQPLHVLINNPGRLFPQRIVTAEGFEQSFASLLLSPFILGESLRPLLAAAPSARLINVSSAVLYSQALRVDDLECTKEDYIPLRVYARARRALLDVGEVWARRWRDSGICVHTMTPGWTDMPLKGRLAELSKAWLRTPDQGADTLIWLAAAPELAQSSGLFWSDRQPRQTALLPGTRSSAATQLALYEKLQSYAQQVGLLQTPT